MSTAPGLWEISVWCLGTLGLAWPGALFLRRQLSGTGTEAWTFGLLFFGGSLCMQVFLEGRGVSYMLRALAWNLVLILLTVLVFPGESATLAGREGRGRNHWKDHWEKKVLAAVVLAAMVQLVLNFAESFLTCLGLVLVHVLMGESSMESRGYGLVLLGTYGATAAVVCLASVWLRPVFAGNKGRWYLYLAVPPMLVLLLTNLVNWAASHGIMFQDWGKYGLLENQLLSHGGICVVTGLSMGAAGFFVVGMSRIDQEARAKDQYRAQVLYYQMLKDQYRSLESLRHDMKNHLIALTGLVKNRQWEAAGRYLEDAVKAGGLEAGEAVTGNPAVDALLYHKRKQAEGQGVVWQCDASRLPRPCRIQDLDLCVILGNILDNALEACGTQGEKGERPFTQIRMGVVKKCLLLEVKNSVSREAAKGLEEPGSPGRTYDQSRRTAGFRWTTKRENPWEHGLGLSNVRQAVEHYDGVVRMETEQAAGIFTVSILLPLSGNRETGMTE